MLKFFEITAGRLKPHRSQILLSAAIGFALLIAMMVLGAPRLLYFPVLLVSWWLWLVNMLIQMFEEEIFTGPVSRYFSLLILLAMAVSPIVWLVR